MNYYRYVILQDVDCDLRYVGAGLARPILTNCVCHVFDWRVRCVNKETVCSASLVALHKAIRLSGSVGCEVATVKGADLVGTPENLFFLV